ncbi:peptidylprolyl isomerase [Nocardia huaxiensis]|uniref:Peptidylprolyl isomerase n=1 Tax=Nocardia huaxiensis TaxID=2755382 RepID=A0A7D6Z7U0_9NOCA|nr:peptidylprolyl isomerase [Nocardia huaxiensis]QLY29108.1 peptidylprolyl isomerase [Nocardia huaxiensis]UFS97403.1 peptidylprolyl isomerase [Nocardia huaxiensis]
MPTNEQRRAAAKRKLERQLANRAERARKRKQITIAASVAGVVVAVAAGTIVWFATRPEPTPPPPFYRNSTDQAARPVEKPSEDKDKLPKGTVKATIETNQGPITVNLDADKAPYTVNSFESLAKQKYFDGTNCHRMTDSEGLKVLQCGDPTASGMGGPGYEFDNEYPTTDYPADDPKAEQPIDYKRGFLAMANANGNAGSNGIDHKGTNGSQFFIVYADSKLPPQYTIFGTVDEAGMATVDKIAALGVVPDPTGQTTQPKEPVTIQSVRID